MRELRKKYEVFVKRWKSDARTLTRENLKRRDRKMINEQHLLLLDFIECNTMTQRLFTKTNILEVFHSKNYPFTLDMLEASINGKFMRELRKKYEVFVKRWKSDARTLTSKGKDFLKNHCSPLKQSLFHYYWWSSQGGWWLLGRDCSKND